MHIYGLGISSLSLPQPPPTSAPLLQAATSTTTSTTNTTATNNTLEIMSYYNSKNRFHQEPPQPPPREQQQLKRPSSSSPTSVLPRLQSAFAPVVVNTTSTVTMSGMGMMGTGTNNGDMRNDSNNNNNNNMMMDECGETPATKRYRHEAALQQQQQQQELYSIATWARNSDNQDTMGTGNNNNGVSTVSMEREDQCDWWKAPSTTNAPLLSSAFTMANHNNSSSNVLGCNACQRLFVPPPSPRMEETAGTKTAGTLLNYFAPVANNNSQKPRAQGTNSNTNNNQQQKFAHCRCTFCERHTCGACLQSCQKCQDKFCKLCMTSAYMNTSTTAVCMQQLDVCMDCANQAAANNNNNSSALTNTSHTTDAMMMEE